MACTPDVRETCKCADIRNQLIRTTRIPKESGMAMHIYKMTHPWMVNIESTIEMRWSPHNPFTLRSGGVWCLANHKFGKVCFIILRVICKKKVQNCFQDQKGLFYVAQRFAVTDKIGSMAIWIPKVRIIEVSPRRQTSVVFQNMPDHPCLCTCGQHSLVRTHKFLGRYYGSRDYEFIVLQLPNLVTFHPSFNHPW